MKVSVCLACYNGSRFIEQQIDSILAQLGQRDELIISDDNSTDNTLMIINKKGDPRIRVYHNSKRGILSNFENAISNSSGDLLFLADQDDIWKKNKIEKIKTHFLDPNVTAVVSNCNIINDCGDVIEKNFFLKNRTKQGFLINLINNGFMGCCMAFRASIKTIILPFPSFIPMHDSFIGLISNLSGKVVFDHEPLVLHRKHDFNSSSTSNFMSNQLVIKKITDRFILIALVTTRHLLRKLLI